MELGEVKDFLDKMAQENIKFDPHFYKRSRERAVNESMVRSFFHQLTKLELVERGKGEDRFKLWFKMSRKYSLVLVVEISTAKGLKVISAWNTDRKWQGKLRQ